MTQEHRRRPLNETPLYCSLNLGMLAVWAGGLTVLPLETIALLHAVGPAVFVWSAIKDRQSTLAVWRLKQRLEELDLLPTDHVLEEVNQYVTEQDGQLDHRKINKILVGLGIVSTFFPSIGLYLGINKLLMSKHNWKIFVEYQEYLAAAEHATPSDQES